LNGSGIHYFENEKKHYEGIFANGKISMGNEYDKNENLVKSYYIIDYPLSLNHLF
jgi:antitoxin component YwqK of YwqJK toxin-antitoxin module